MRAENPNDLMLMACSLFELWVLSAVLALCLLFTEKAARMLAGHQPLPVYSVTMNCMLLVGV
jgi:uncharacterized membrane protein